MKLLKYHLTRRQALILGSLGSVLVALFGPASTLDFGSNGHVTHVTWAILIPALVGLVDDVFHNISGVVPTKPTSNVSEGNWIKVGDALVQVAEDGSLKIKPTSSDISASVPQASTQE